jgi:beta-N-acetylhexosaminidase
VAHARGVPADGPADATSAAAVAATFRLSGPGRAFLSDPAPLAVVQVGSTPNLAVGEVAWGPAALGATAAEADVPAGTRVAVVGRAVGPDHPAHEVAARLRADGHRVVLVDCGWPRGGADVETYGGSPAVARALLALLRGEVAA